MKIQCKKCGNVHDIDIDWEHTLTEERQMGGEYFYNFECDIKCDCDMIIEIQLEASEYPIGDPKYIFVENIKNGFKV